MSSFHVYIWAFGDASTRHGLKARHSRFPRRSDGPQTEGAEGELEDAKFDFEQFVFKQRQFTSIKKWLHRLSITPKLVYPDLTGLAKSMNGNLDFCR